MNFDRVGLGDRLRRLRKGKGPSQLELEQLSGVSNTTIQEIERGDGNPTVETLQALADALDCEIEDFLGEGKAETLQPSVDWNECARVLEALQSAPEHRKLLALHLLLKDDSYMKRLEKLEGFAPVAQLLRKVP
jgi:transcriptional regulator with XRE-family HTH domain